MARGKTATLRLMTLIRALIAAQFQQHGFPELLVNPATAENLNRPLVAY